jgi:hypothetical protein
MLSQTYSLNRQTSTVLGSGSFGVVEKARSEDRVVGLDLVVWGSLVKWSKAAQAMLVVTRLARGVSVGGQSPGCHVLAISTALKGNGRFRFRFLCDLA